jgi:hypothetical protein
MINSQWTKEKNKLKLSTVKAILSVISIYWVPQNSRNNSMRQCQLMLEDNEKNNKKILYLLDLKIWGLKMCSFDLIYFKY